MPTVPGTTIGGAIDYLLAGLQTPLQALAADLVLADGMPQKTSMTTVVIGRNGPASGMATDMGSVQYVELGLQRVEESYLIHCFAQVYRPSQKQARDAVIGLYNTVVAFVAADPTFGGLLQRGRVGLVTQLQLEQTADERDTGSGGLRLAAIDFALHVHNAYVPTP